MVELIIGAGAVLGIALCLIALAVIRYKEYAEEKAIRKVAKAFPEIETYWGAKINAADNLQAIDKEKETLRANIDEYSKYFPNSKQYTDSLKEDYCKACLEEKQYEEEVKKAIQRIRDYEKAHFGEEKGYFWPAFF